MSSVGRIFLVLNLFLAAAFLGWSANVVSVGQDWKGKYEDKVTEAETAAQEAADEQARLAAMNQTLEREKADASEERDDLQGRVTGLENDLAQANTENAELRASIEGINSTLGDYNSTIASVSSDKDDAIERAHSMERERDDAMEAQQAAELAQADAERRLETANLQIDDLRMELVAVNESLSQRTTELESLVAYTGTTLQDILNVPKINGEVVTVKSEGGVELVALNVGASNDVKQGMAFEIYDGIDYKGRVRVRHLMDTKCAAEIIFSVDGETIASGDKATTRF